MTHTHTHTHTHTGWKVQLTPAALQFVPRQPFHVPGIDGRWVAERIRAPTSTLVDVYGIDQRANDDEVAAALVCGSAKLLHTEDAERLQTLRVRRLLARAPSGGETAAGAERQETAASRITRACRVYLPPDLAQFFCQRGEMMFDFVGRRVKEYVPTQFYCKYCRKMGSHSSQYHRAPRAEGVTDTTQTSGQRYPPRTGPPREGRPQAP